MTQPSLLIRHPAGYTAERRYAAEVLLSEFLGLGCEMQEAELRDVEISLRGDGDGEAGGGRLTIADGLFRTPRASWLTPAALPRAPLRRWNLATADIRPALVSPLLPVLYGEPLEDGSFMDQRGPRMRIGADLFGACLFMLTRYEEIVSSQRDERCRFPSAASVSHQGGFLDRPIVTSTWRCCGLRSAACGPRCSAADASFASDPAMTSTGAGARAGRWPVSRSSG